VQVSIGSGRKTTATLYCTYEKIKELEDAFVGEDVQGVPRSCFHDRQTMYFVLHQPLQSVVQAAQRRKKMQAKIEHLLAGVTDNKS